MFNPILGTIGSLRIHEVEAMVVYAGEDWSKVRSPGRARRRRKKHRQNITALYEPDGNYLVDQVRGVIYCHPAMARKLIAAALKTNGGDHGHD
ncbi:MAG: hypothetical protein LCH99_04460 [Proteobacteria bacterium]|nr:hypothetical protein [Pseudomonadota bacterium]